MQRGRPSCKFTETAGRSCLSDRLQSVVHVDGTHSLTDMPNMMSVVHVWHLSRHGKHVVTSVCQLATKLSAPACAGPSQHLLMFGISCDLVNN